MAASYLFINHPKQIFVFKFIHVAGSPFLHLEDQTDYAYLPDKIQDKP